MDKFGKIVDTTGKSACKLHVVQLPSLKVQTNVLLCELYNDKLLMLNHPQNMKKLANVFKM